MAVFLLLSIVVPTSLGCNARSVPRNRAKIVEEYVVSANFDQNKNIPQLTDRSQSREIYQQKETRSREASLFVPEGPRGTHRDSAQPADVFEDPRNTLEDRDFLVHHHHTPLPLPPPPPAGLAYTPSLFAVGLITFFILLNGLQTTLLLLKSKGSALGPVTGALGRRKRSTLGNFDKFLENQGNQKLNFAFKK